MPATKLTIIGAGSAFTYAIVSDLIRSPALSGSTVALVDIDPEALELSTRIVTRMIAETGADLNVEDSTDRRQVLAGSEFVLNSISVGEPWARERDVDIGERYGIYQPTSQTVGPAGFCRGLRVVPHAVAIAGDIAEICPHATVIDLANPLAAVTRAMIREAGITVIGLCHAWKRVLPVFASLLEVPEEDLVCVSAGTNHLTWVLALYHRGHDVLPEFLERLQSPAGRAVRDTVPVSWEVYDTFGLWPAGYELHTAEFFAYFLTPETHGGGDYGLETRHTTRQAYEAMWVRRRDLAEGASLEELLQPSDEGVVEIIASLLGAGEPACHTLNIPNEGLVDNLPHDMIVELPVYVSTGGVRGLKVGPLPQPVAQLLSTRAVQQELLVDAALSGNHQTALQGLLLDPQIASLSVARSILDESLATNAEWLPAFQG